jgi:hypothetical protein
MDRLNQDVEIIRAVCHSDDNALIEDNAPRLLEIAASQTSEARHYLRSTITPKVKEALVVYLARLIPDEPSIKRSECVWDARGILDELRGCDVRVTLSDAEGHRVYTEAYTRALLACAWRSCANGWEAAWQGRRDSWYRHNTRRPGTWEIEHEQRPWDQLFEVARVVLCGDTTEASREISRLTRIDQGYLRGRDVAEVIRRVKAEVTLDLWLTGQVSQRYLWRPDGQVSDLEWTGYADQASRGAARRGL